MLLNMIDSLAYRMLLTSRIYSDSDSNYLLLDYSLFSLLSSVFSIDDNVYLSQICYSMLMIK